MSPLVPPRKIDPGEELPALEAQVLERWRARDVFAESLRQRQDGEVKVFWEGPPTANGRPGSHHVLTRVFKDMYMRFMTMRGYRVERKAGWDCHGLPVEIAVEQELGIRSKAEVEEYGIERFNARCRQLVLAYLKDWERFTERIGFWLDLDNAYMTQDEEYIESVWWALRQLHEKDLLYKDHKVVPYCLRCGTTLSSHEVALGYKNVVDESVYLRMRLLDPPSPLQEGDELLAWTTMAWTLPVNAAVAVNPEMTYVRARAADGDGPAQLVAEALVGPVLGADAEILDRIPGQALEGIAYEPPFDYFTAADHGPRGHTILLSDFVTDEDGTGLVHTVPAFGEQDFSLGREHGLNVVNPVRTDGTYDERLGEFADRHVKEATPDLIEDLRRRGRLLLTVGYEHSYPHCWRCQTALIYYAKPSWYVATAKIRDRMVEGNREVKWHPSHIRDGRFGDWLENNVDWALSRERYWGTPLPIWTCAEGHVHVVGSFAELEELSGRELADHHRPYVDEIEFPCMHAEDGEPCGEPMRRLSDVIDVWFDSGAVPFAQYHHPFAADDRFAEQFPADFICEAQDQTRGWFYSLLAISTALFDTKPFREILCLGLIVDREGQKMSKSRGNSVEPWEVTNTYGADAFRWYFFTAKQPWDGYRFSPEAISETVRLFLKPLWRTYSFYVLYAHANAETLSDAEEMPGFDGTANEPQGSVGDDLDAWILSRTTATAEVVTTQMERYDAHAAGRALAELVDELSNWYVRRSRRRFWDGDPAAFRTLHRCLLTISRLLAPFCPFMADEIYDNLDGSRASVHLCDFPAADELAPRDRELEEAMALARETVRLGLRVRNTTRIKVRQPLAEAVVVADEHEQAMLERLQGIVFEELNVKRLQFVAGDDELVRCEVKPNFRSLGPLFGKDMPQVVEAIAALDPANVATAIDEGRKVGIGVAGRMHSLGAEDLTFSKQPLGSYAVEQDGERAVALDVTIDDQLWREGISREVVRVVQQARKNAGLPVEARIELALAGDSILLETASEHLEHLAKETLAVKVQFGFEDWAEAPLDHREQGEIDGLQLTALVRGMPVAPEPALPGSYV
jgi:isoleucyl-tRNA synthetase